MNPDLRARDTLCLRAAGAPPIVVNAAMERARELRTARLAAGAVDEGGDEVPAEPGPTASTLAPPPAAPEVARSQPRGTETPCEWLLRERAAGSTLPGLIQLATDQRDLFTSADRRCLKKADVHASVLAATEPLPAPVAPRYTIQVLSVVAGPAKAGGSAPWDLDPSLSQPAFEAALKMATVYMATGASLAVGGLLKEGGPAIEAVGDQVLQGMKAPDIFGYVELAGPDVPVAWNGIRVSLLAPTSAAKNAYYTTFPGSPGYRAVEVGPEDMLRVTLYDADLTDPDPMGVVTVSGQQLLAAAEAAVPVFVDATGATQGQILLVEFTVMRAAPGTPGFIGAAFR